MDQQPSQKDPYMSNPMIPQQQQQIIISVSKSKEENIQKELIPIIQEANNFESLDSNNQMFKLKSFVNENNNSSFNGQSLQPDLSNKLVSQGIKSEKITKKDSKNNKKNKQASKKTAKPKRQTVIIDNFDQFIPQFLICLNNIKTKSVIRIGKDYQIMPDEVPQFRSKYQSLDHLKIWEGCKNKVIDPQTNSIINQQQFFNEDTFQVFKNMFGQHRNEEELIHLLVKFNCNWHQIQSFLIKNQESLDKLYKAKDLKRDKYTGL